MRKFISVNAVTFIFMMSLSFASNAWNVVRDFNSGTLGSKAWRTADGFDDATTGIYDNTQSIDGQSIKTSIKKGSTGFGDWGGIINFPSKVAKGGKVYFEMYIYIPGFFQVDSGNGSLKFLRFYADHADGSNGGALDIQITDDNRNSSQFRMLKEKQFIWYAFANKGVLKRDRWHKVNVEFGVDNVPASQGGNSYVKFWLDGVLLTHQKDIQTIVQATDQVKNFLLFTYYNNASPIDQHVWADNIRISNVRPAWWDSLAAGAVAPPNPPSPY